MKCLPSIKPRCWSLSRCRFRSEFSNGNVILYQLRPCPSMRLSIRIVFRWINVITGLRCRCGLQERSRGGAVKSLMSNHPMFRLHALHHAFLLEPSSSALPSGDRNWLLFITVQPIVLASTFLYKSRNLTIILYRNRYAITNLFIVFGNRNI